MAASLHRPTKASYVVHEKVTVDTTDREDHTFCGIMFPIKCKSILPLDHLVVNSVSVRGRLGPLTVWVTKDPDDDDAADDVNTGNGQIPMKKRSWKKIYERTHAPSFRDYTELDLSSSPIVLKPNQVRGVYVHSTLDGDEALVYDNKTKPKTHDDDFLTIFPGRAHVSTTVFGTEPIWGWGNAWRDNREFVGKVSYGAVYKLWNPQEHLKFGDNFRGLARILFLCQRRWESPLSRLPDECIFYVLNMCRWDWVQDTAREMKASQKRNPRLGIQADSSGVDGSNEQGGQGATEGAAAVEYAFDDVDGGNDEEDDSGVNDNDSDEDEEWVGDIESDNEEEVFQYYDVESDDSGAEDEEAAELQRAEQRRRTWLRRHVATIHVLRSLVSNRSHGAAPMDVDGEDD